MGNAVEKYRSAMNRVQVDAAVLQRTEQRIMDALAQDAGLSSIDHSITRHSSTRHTSSRRSTASRRGLDARWTIKYARMAMAVILLAVILPLGAYAYTMTPVSYLDLDINPSVEIRLNRLGNILDIMGVNQDGKQVLEGLDLKGLAVPDVIETIVQAAHTKGYLGYDKPEAISLTVSDNNEARASKLSVLAGDAVRAGLGEEGANVSFVEASIGLAQVEEARSLEAKDIFITPGKLNLIEKLQAVSGDTSFVASDWYGKTVQEIVAATKERKGNPAPEGESGESEGTGNASATPDAKSTPAAIGSGKSSAPGQNKLKENNGKSDKTDVNESTITTGGVSVTATPASDPGNGKTGKETGNIKSDNAPGQVKKSSSEVKTGKDDSVSDEVLPVAEDNVTNSSIDANTADPSKEDQAADPSTEEKATGSDKENKVTGADKEDKTTGSDKENKVTGADKEDKTTGPAVDVKATDSTESASSNNGKSDAAAPDAPKDKPAKKDK